ncbi:HdeD family acid-resistance protein [Actinomadura scrupuli]|uniref:HdeD family acid-resistance protein n=1 Tax=Actinomadura scrupuli TaxID=559629 RepID=UPI003D96BAAD
MLEQLSRHWWMLAVRGVCAIIFGLLAWIWPGITLLVLVILFGAYAFVDGVLALGAAFKSEGGRSRVWLAVVGVAGVLLGLVTLFWPHITGLVLLLLIAWWAIVTGAFEIVAAIRMRKEIEGEWLYIVSGAVSVIFGVLVLVWPATGALAIVWLIGLFSILFGATLIAAAIRLRKLGQVAQPV